MTPIREPPAATHTAATCRWGMPTLFLEPPAWLAAWDTPWSCVRVLSRSLESTAECGTCPNWEPRSGESATAGGG